MKAPAFQFYAADYLSDENVQLMTLEQEGAYIRLLSYCWREGSIPNNDEKLSCLCKGARAEVVTAVKQMFEQDPNDVQRLLNNRLEIERQKQKNFRGGKVKAGIESGKSRRQKKFSTEQVFDSVRTKPERNRTLLSSSSSSSSISDSPPPTPSPQEGTSTTKPELDWDSPDPSFAARELARELQPRHPALSSLPMAEAAFEREILKGPDALKFCDSTRRTHAQHCLIWAEQRARNPNAYIPQLHVWARDGIYLQSDIRTLSTAVAKKPDRFAHVLKELERMAQ